MPRTRFRAALRIGRAAPNSSGAADEAGKTSRKGRGYLIALGLASIILLALLLLGLGVFNPPAATSGSTTTASTSYAVEASSVIASAATQTPAGYAEGSSKPLNANEQGLESGGYALFSNQGESLANMTILVFNTSKSAQAYIGSVVANSKELSGYSDLSSALASYQRYGTCYGYGETDPEGAGAVATGVCTKGNVYIQVHVASSSSLPSAEGDMSNLVGAAYQGTS